MGNYTFEHLNSTKHYSQTCSNNHFYQQPMLSPPKQSPTQSLLSNMTGNHFFDSQMKKTRLKQLQNFIQQKMQKK